MNIGVISLQHDAPTYERHQPRGIGEIVILPVLPLIRAGGDAKRCGGIRPPWCPCTQGQSMNITLEGVGPERRQMHPVVATSDSDRHHRLDARPTRYGGPRGSTIMLVVRGIPDRQGRVTPKDNASQLLPPSCERKASGLVPQKSSQGLQHRQSPTRSGCRPWAIRSCPTYPRYPHYGRVPHRYRPGGAGDIGYTARVLTLHSEGMGF